VSSKQVFRAFSDLDKLISAPTHLMDSDTQKNVQLYADAKARHADGCLAEAVEILETIKSNAFTVQ
jgi:hypothetical protein